MMNNIKQRIIDDDTLVDNVYDAPKLNFFTGEEIYKFIEDNIGLDDVIFEGKSYKEICSTYFKTAIISPDQCYAARKVLLKEVFKAFISKNFIQPYNKEFTITFQGRWRYPMYSMENYQLGNTNSDFSETEMDYYIDRLLPLSFTYYSVSFIEVALATIHVRNLEENTMDLYIAPDFLSNTCDIILGRPHDFPHYRNINKSIIEYNYFHPDDEACYIINKVCKIVNNQVYFYDRNGRIIKDGN